MSKKKTSKPAPSTIEDKLNQREQQITTALTEIIDTIEKYFTIAPFQWIEGPAEEIGVKCFPDVKSPFNRFDAWFDHWLGELFPEAHGAQRSLDAGTDKGEAPGELAFAAQKLGFLCGVLVGSKNMGATRDQLLEQCEGYILPTMEWERWRMTEGPEARSRKGIAPMDEKEIEEFRTNLAARLERVPPEQRRACMEAILSKIRVIKAEAQRERIAREKWQRERDKTREKS